LEEELAKYKCHLEKLKNEKEALKAEKEELQHQLEEARSKVEAEAAAGAKRSARGPGLLSGMRGEQRILLGTPSEPGTRCPSPGGLL